MWNCGRIANRFLDKDRRPDDETNAYNHDPIPGGNMKCIGVAFAFFSLIAGAPVAETEGTRGAQTVRTLVVYYSLTGKTDVVARTLAKELKADLRRVEDVETPSVSWWFYISAGFAAKRGMEAEIKPIDVGMEEYDRVFIGSPVWGGSPSTPINAFISKADFTGKEVVLFVTMGGKDASAALKKMRTRIETKGGRIVGSLSFTSRKRTNEELAARTREMMQRYR
jgi:flavodoxin